MLLNDVDNCPNYVARQKEGVQREGEDQVGDQRNGGQTGTPTSCANAPTGLSRSGVSDAKNRKKYSRWYGAPLHMNSRGGYRLVLSSLDNNGGSYKRMNGVGKG